MPARIPLTQVQIALFCRQNTLRRLHASGLVVRGDRSPASDINPSAEFGSDAMVGPICRAQMETDLSELFGRTGDLMTPGVSRQPLRDQPMADTAVRYEAP